MPPPYLIPQWNQFLAIPHRPQGHVGVSPSTWANRFHLSGIPNVRQLPNHQLDRLAVRAICTNPAEHVLYGYVCVMAWGGQGSGYGRQQVTMAWGASRTIAAHLTILRGGGLTRRDAYNLFCGAGAIPGLGPSFFTKLLYFFTPKPMDCYIMDPWTAKSVNLLTWTQIVMMPGDTPSRINKGGNYQVFCEEIDEMARLVGCPGQEVEERLFSQGGRHPWPWRNHMRGLTRLLQTLPAYDAHAMHATYPHIPVTEF